MRPRRPDLSGLTAAIRLKTTLLQELATRPSAEWPEDVERFIAAVESCDLGDATALLVLLADVKEGIRVFTGLPGSGDTMSEPGPALPEGLSKREIGVTPVVYKTAVLGLVPRSESEAAAEEAPKR